MKARRKPGCENIHYKKSSLSLSLSQIFKMNIFLNLYVHILACHYICFVAMSNKKIKHYIAYFSTVYMATNRCIRILFIYGFGFFFGKYKVIKNGYSIKYYYKFSTYPNRIPQSHGMFSR